MKLTLFAFPAKPPLDNSTIQTGVGEPDLIFILASIPCDGQSVSSQLLRRTATQSEGTGLLDLTVLHLDAPGVTTNQANVMAEQAEVCMAENGHAPGVPCVVKSTPGSMIPISWNISSDQERLKAGHADLQEATEGAAAGVAIAYIKHAHDLVVTARSPKDGNGFDYFVAPKGSGSIFRSKPTARLEVSGVLSNGETECRARLKQKAAQVRTNLPAGLGTFAIVIGFKQPSLWIEST